jgi:hypothetical protein
MPDQAHVTSLEALEKFRASLITYISKARPTLEEMSGDILRTRLWLQNDQRVHWEGQLRRRAKELEMAQQSLSSARFSNLREASAAEVMAVKKAKRAQDESEAKLKRLKQWDRDYDNRVQPMAKELEKLHSLLANDMMQAAAYLARAIDTLAKYADVSPGSGSALPNAPGSTAEIPAGESGGAVVPPRENS